MNTNTWLLPDYTEQAKAVVEFNSVLGHPSLPEEREWRIQKQEKLIQEEYEEMIEAFDAKDKEGFIKELCDLFVVLSYRLYLRDKDCLDTEAFVVTNRFGGPPLYSTCRTVSDWIHIKDWLTAVKVVIGLLNSLDVDSKKALDKVCANNMSKYPPYHQGCEEEYDKECKAIEVRNNGRYHSVVWSVQNGHVVFQDHTGKIMKPMNYQPVDLKDCF